MLIEPDRLIPFVAAPGSLILSPGPAQAVVITRGLSAGPHSGMTASPGLNTGTFRPAVAAGLGLFAILTVIGLKFGSIIASAAGWLGQFLARNQTVERWRKRLTGCAFISLGVRLAFEKR